MASDRKKHGELPCDLIGVMPIQMAIASYSNLPQTPADKPICTWDLSTTEGRARLHQVISGESYSLWDSCESGELLITVSDMAAHFSSFQPQDGDGELVAGPMLTLIGPNRSYHSGSANVYESLRQLMLLEGPPPWNPPVRLRISRAPTRNKRTRCVVAYIGR